MGKIICEECGKEFDDTNEVCPNCGYKRNKKKSKLKFIIPVIIVVIIVLSILVSVNILSSNKNEVYDTYQQIDEKAEVSWKNVYDNNGKLIEVTNGLITANVGDYVNYNAGTEGTYTSSSAVNGALDQVFNTSSYIYSWRILRADEETGELLIVSEELIGPDSEGLIGMRDNRSKYGLKGQAGYANCESELNAICSIYGNGTGATGARSINVDDINKMTGYNPDTTSYKKGYIYEYGNEVTYFWQGTDYPYYSASNGLTGSLSQSHSSYFYWYDNEWKNSPKSSTASTIRNSMEDITTLTSSYYVYDGLNRNGISSRAIDLLYYNSPTGAYSEETGTTSCFNYWLSSSCVLTDDDYVSFCVRYVSGGYTMACTINTSNNWEQSFSLGLRPVVSLSPEISLSGGSSEGWNIE